MRPCWPAETGAMPTARRGHALEDMPTQSCQKLWAWHPSASQRVNRTSGPQTAAKSTKLTGMPFAYPFHLVTVGVQWSHWWLNIRFDSFDSENRPKILKT